MQAGGMISAVAAATGTSEVTCKQHFRMLREAGLITSGPHGVNAPDMMPLDFARMLIAVMVSDDRPARAVEMVKDFGKLAATTWQPAKDEAERTLDRVTGLPVHHTFEEAVAGIIERFRWPDMPGLEKTTITIRRSNLVAQIRVIGGDVRYEAAGVAGAALDGGSTLRDWLEGKTLGPDGRARIDDYISALSAVNRHHKRLRVSVEVTASELAELGIACAATRRPAPPSTGAAI